jgi:hypothetical protein
MVILGRDGLTLGVVQGINNRGNIHGQNRFDRVNLDPIAAGL